MSDLSPIRTLIVDDELLACERVRMLLAEDDDFDVVGTCHTAAEAVAMIREEPPDLLFLDVQMPEADGFDLLSDLDAETIPLIIFVTAYDQYMENAFEVHAVDYLLKPFGKKRFRKAAAWAKQQIRQQQAAALNQRLHDLIDALQHPRSESEHTYLERIPVKTAGRIQVLKADTIDWIEAADNYVKLHAAGTAYLHRETLSGIEAQLDPAQFVRIHRSTIVNLDRVRELEPHTHREFWVVLHDGTRLKMSRGYREHVEQQVGWVL